MFFFVGTVKDVSRIKEATLPSRIKQFWYKVE